MKRQRIDVFLRQEDATSAAMRGKTVVLIDVLRASTTLTAALAAGAREVVCFPTVREVFRARKALAPRPVLLCGERGGSRVRGFDLGNSPRHFTPRRCAGRPLLMSTPNGTRALKLTHAAGEIIIGCFANLSAAADHLSSRGRDVALLCAGTEGRLSLDDVACAGAIIEKLAPHPAPLPPAARQALRTWRRAKRSLKKFLLASEGGVPLVRIGLRQDVLDCARRDRFRIIPRVAARQDGCRVIPLGQP